MEINSFVRVKNKRRHSPTTLKKLIKTGQYLVRVWTESKHIILSIKRKFIKIIQNFLKIM